MTKQIIIGKEGNQPFAIPDPKVSRRHAILYIDEQAGKMFLMDIGSTNGTYIFNGRQFIPLTVNKQYSVAPDTMIQLGPETRFHIKRLISANTQQQCVNSTKDSTPAKIDIHQLHAVSNKYIETKMKLESRSGIINGLRSCTLLVSLFAGGISGYATSSMDLGESTKLWNAVIGVVIGGVLMAVLLIIINSFNKKLIKERADNDHMYAVKYCCPNPKCKYPYRGKIYENILAEGRCPKCKAVYYDSSESNH